jgi:ABC-type transport system involved in cytochrome c biogenesis permease subunit
MIQRLPSLEQLDRLNYRCIGWGFPLLTLGILSGGIWAASTWGSFWSWEPREVLSLITWIIYAALLQFRLTTGLRGRRAATLTIVGFGVLVASYVSINLLPLPGRHGGGFGS